MQKFLFLPRCINKIGLRSAGGDGQGASIDFQYPCPWHATTMAFTLFDVLAITPTPRWRWKAADFKDHACMPYSQKAGFSPCRHLLLRTRAIEFSHDEYVAEADASLRLLDKRDFGRGELRDHTIFCFIFVFA
jgi:hypothetical protein